MQKIPNPVPNREAFFMVGSWPEDLDFATLHIIDPKGGRRKGHHFSKVKNVQKMSELFYLEDFLTFLKSYHNSSCYINYMILFIRMEHQANLLWIPADSMYNINEVTNWQAIKCKIVKHNSLLNSNLIELRVEVDTIIIQSQQNLNLSNSYPNKMGQSWAKLRQVKIFLIRHRL